MDVNIALEKVSGGMSSPLGTSLDTTGCNFAIYCPDAQAVTLCLYHCDTETETLVAEFQPPAYLSLYPSDKGKG